MNKYWNYRVIQSTNGCSIHEVHYENDIPVAWTENSIFPFGEDFSELAADFNLMSQALLKPILRIVNDTLVEIE